MQIRKLKCEGGDKMQRNKSLSLIIGIILITSIIVLVAFANVFAPYDPIEQVPENRLMSFSSKHIFGTDQYGRDIFSRVLFGGRTTLTTSLSALILTVILGLFLGMVSGYYGGLIDALLMRIVDVMMAFPFMVLALIVTSLFGISFLNLLITVVVIGWVPFARLTRSIVIDAKENTNVQASEILGAKSWRIMIEELLPQVISPVLVMATFELGKLMLSISALSFFGLGAKPPSPEWGSMLSDGKTFFFQAPYIIVGPTLAIILSVLSLNLIGEGLRDLMDPYEIPKLEDCPKRRLLG